MSNKLPEPTYENLINHYVKDTIGRNEDLFYFVRVLSSLAGGNAVALNGVWGSGKTFFIKQAKMLIDINNPNSDIDVEISNANEKLSDEQNLEVSAAKQIETIKTIYESFNEGAEKYDMQKMATVYYDAWKYDNTSDPLLSLIYCVMTRYNEEVNPSKVEWMKSAMWKSLPLFNGLVKSVTGLDIKESLEGLKNLLETREDWFKQMKKENDIEQQVSQFLTDIVSEEDKLVIFIDELDRCNPQYAVKLLERVKHYFNHPKVVFVISYNKMELQHSIKTLYGSEFNADKYLERFFDYEFGLRATDVDRYLGVLGSNNSTINANMNTIVKMYDFSMREIWKYQDYMKKAIAMLPKLISNNIYSEEESLSFYITWFMPIVAGLHFHNVNSYKIFIAGNGFKYYEEFFDSHLKSKDHHFGRLLNGNEEYNENATFSEINGTKQTTLKSKFKQLYDAMFGNNIGKNEVEIGYVIVNSEVRKEFINICNGISRLADYGEKDESTSINSNNESK